jgi:putative hydrolase of the HAD superfamily
VLEAIGVGEHFDELHDIHASELKPKPDPHGYALLCERFGIDPGHALLVDDMAANLKPAKALGMTTVWVDNGSERGGHGADDGFIDRFIDHRITDVAEWLESILEDNQ